MTRFCFWDGKTRSCAAGEPLRPRCPGQFLYSRIYTFCFPESPVRDMRYPLYWVFCLRVSGCQLCITRSPLRHPASPGSARVSVPRRPLVCGPPVPPQCLSPRMAEAPSTPSFSRTSCPFCAAELDLSGTEVTLASAKRTVGVASLVLLSSIPQILQIFYPPDM